MLTQNNENQKNSDDSLNDLLVKYQIDYEFYDTTNKSYLSSSKINFKNESEDEYENFKVKYRLSSNFNDCCHRDTFSKVSSSFTSISYLSSYLSDSSKTTLNNRETTEVTNKSKHFIKR